MRHEFNQHFFWYVVPWTIALYLVLLLLGVQGGA